MKPEYSFIYQNKYLNIDECREKKRREEKQLQVQESDSLRAGVTGKEMTVLATRPPRRLTTKSTLKIVGRPFRNTRSERAMKKAQVSQQYTNTRNTLFLKSSFELGWGTDQLSLSVTCHCRASKAWVRL